MEATDEGKDETAAAVTEPEKKRRRKFSAWNIYQNKMKETRPGLSRQQVKESYDAESKEAKADYQKEADEKNAEVERGNMHPLATTKGPGRRRKRALRRQKPP